MSAKLLNGNGSNGFTQLQTVKRLLRNTDSQKYFKDGDWTNNPEEADSFSDVVEAAEICAQHGLTGVELAVRLDAQACDVFCTPMR
jgi:hypothetical protein